MQKEHAEAKIDDPVEKRRRYFEVIHLSLSDIGGHRFHEIYILQQVSIIWVLNNDNNIRLLTLLTHLVYGTA